MKTPHTLRQRPLRIPWLICLWCLMVTPSYKPELHAFSGPLEPVFSSLDSTLAWAISSQPWKGRATIIPTCNFILFSIFCQVSIVMHTRSNPSLLTSLWDTEFYITFSHQTHKIFKILLHLSIITQKTKGF